MSRTFARRARPTSVLAACRPGSVMLTLVGALVSLSAARADGAPEIGARAASPASVAGASRGGYGVHETEVLRTFAALARLAHRLEADYLRALEQLGWGTVLAPATLAAPGGLERAAWVLEAGRAVVTEHRARAMHAEREIREIVAASGLDEPWASELRAGVLLGYAATARHREAIWRLERRVIDALEEQLSVLRYGGGWTVGNDTFLFNDEADVQRFNAASNRLDAIIIRQLELKRAMRQAGQAQGQDGGTDAASFMERGI